jgi:dGTP triphosphohydrolase
MKMTITRALVELKTLNKRIMSAIDVLNPVTVVTGKNIPRGFETRNDFEKEVNSKFESVNTLIARRKQIKSGIVTANAATYVEIAGVKMTIAEAIERKTSIALENALLHKLSSTYALNLKNHEQMEMKCNEQLHRLLEVNFGKDSKAKTEEVDAITKPYLENNAPKFIDPLDVKKKIEELENSISKFIAEVDVVLSEANAKTEIEVND